MNHINPKSFILRAWSGLSVPLVTTRRRCRTPLSHNQFNKIARDRNRTLSLLAGWTKDWNILSMFCYEVILVISLGWERDRELLSCACVCALCNYCPIMPALFVRGYTRKNTLNCALRVIFKGESHDRRWRLVTKPSNVASRLLCGFRHTARASASMTSDPLAHLHLVQLREGGANSAGVTVQSREPRWGQVLATPTRVSAHDGAGELPWPQTDVDAVKTAAKTSTDNQNTSFNRFIHQMLHHTLLTRIVYLLITSARYSSTVIFDLRSIQLCNILHILCNLHTENQTFQNLWIST